MKSSLKEEKRDINWVRNLPAFKALIDEVKKTGAFGRIWSGSKECSLYGSHILLMTTDEVVSILGKKEPFKVVHYTAGGSRSLELLGKVAKILRENDVKISKSAE